MCWADPDLAQSNRRHSRLDPLARRGGTRLVWKWAEIMDLGRETVEGATRIEFGPLAKERRSASCYDGLGKSAGFNSI